MDSGVGVTGSLWAKIMKWMIGEEHEYYGVVVMCRTIEGEPYRFFDKDGCISMIPLDCLNL